MLSLTIMCLLYKRENFSVLGISIAGAVFHNLGQILMAMVAVSSFNVMYYFPILMIVGVLTGLVIGIVSREMLARIK